MKIEAVAHPNEIQEEAGHGSYNTTMNVSGHLFDSCAEKTAEAMEAMNHQSLAAKSNVRAIR